jgi:hypothetical protein
MKTQTAAVNPQPEVINPYPLTGRLFPSHELDDFAFKTVVEAAQLLDRYMRSVDYEWTTPAGKTAGEVSEDLAKLIWQLLINREVF